MTDQHMLTNIKDYAILIDKTQNYNVNENHDIMKSRSRSQILLFVLPYPADHQPECTFPGT